MIGGICQHSSEVCTVIYAFVPSDAGATSSRTSFLRGSPRLTRLPSTQISGTLAMRSAGGDGYAVGRVAYAGG